MMKRDILRRLMALAITGFMGLTGAGSAFGLTVYKIGGDEYSWTDAMEEYDRIDFESTEGMIQPIKVDPEERIPMTLAPFGNIYNAVYYIDGVEEGNKVLDGDSNTALERPLALAGGGIRGRFAGARKTSGADLYLDLGASYTVNRIKIYPREEFMHRFIRQFKLRINDGNPENTDLKGNPIWKTIREVDQNEEPIVEISIEPQLVRYLMLDPDAYANDRVWEIAEFEVYGQDYVPEASYLTKIIDFGGSEWGAGEIASWGKIRWSGKRHGDAKVMIRTRTGLDDDPNIYWRKTGTRGEETPLTEKGRLLTRKDYEKLPYGVRGKITYDTENWSFWSAPYDFEDGLEGVPIVSPGPARSFQLRIDFFPTPTEGVEIDFIEFQLSKPPAAQEVVAEIFPLTKPGEIPSLTVRPGEVTTFKYALTLRIKSGDTGFDGIEIQTPARADAIRSVSIDGMEVPFTIESIEDDRFSLTFPRVEIDGTLVEAIFDARVFTYGTIFRGWVFDSQTEEVPQLISPGDATIESENNDLAVRTILGGPLIKGVDVSPNPFTPNGDGVNDSVEISYTLLSLVNPAPVSVEIYDLSGALVKTVYSGTDIAGQFSQTWDGTDEYGELVSPGIYLYRISVDTDKGKEDNPGIVAVVY